MKKKLFAILLLLAMLTPTLAACGNDVPEETESDADVQETVGGEETSDTVNLVTDGVSEYVIVRGENATADEIKASTELQSYLLKITGAELPIVTDATPAVEKEIVIGLTNREAEGQFDREELDKDGFIIKTEASKLWLIGGSRGGTLYAAYELLEAYLGCRFFNADLEIVPEQKTVTLHIAEDKQIPQFPIRMLSGAAAINDLDKLRMRGAIWAGGACHTLPALGEVGSGNGAVDPDPCLQSEESFQTVLKNVRALLEATPNADFISISQTDAGTPARCTCEKCRTYEAENGVSANYLQFVNRIAEAIKDDYPNVLVHTFAYKETSELPKNDIVAADNVMVQLCTHDSCFSHPLAECDVINHSNMGSVENFLAEPTKFRDIPELMDGWSKICKYLTIWDYTENFECYPVDMPCLDVMWQNYGMYAQYNIAYFFVDGCGLSNAFNFTGLKGYLLSKLMWDPDMGKEAYYAYMDEYLEAYYGPGWKYIRAHIDNLEEESTKYHFSFNVKPWELMLLIHDDSNKNKEIPELSADTLRNYKDVDWSQYYYYFTTPVMNDILETGLSLFASAKAEAQTEEQLYRIEGAAIHLDAMNVYYTMTEYSKCISPALTKIYEGNLKARLADGSMTQEEADSLKTAFKTDIIGPIKDAASPNVLQNELAKKCLSYGVSMLRANETFQQFLDGEVRFWQ